MSDVHPNFKAGYENMLRIAATKHGKKVYGRAVGRAKPKELALEKSKK